jgi:hypothetical protein
MMNWLITQFSFIICIFGTQRGERGERRMRKVKNHCNTMNPGPLIWFKPKDRNTGSKEKPEQTTLC